MMEFNPKQLKALHSLTKTWRSGVRLHTNTEGHMIVIRIEDSGRWVITRTGHASRA